ncbi:GntR family transcriptional regulator [Trujillonella humicola]|uniref:GntR family transcriptional regulator n=1 Tax=Trujillonella humicola TaxID=3383699 RepID=UPI003905FD9F
MGETERSASNLGIADVRRQGGPRLTAGETELCVPDGHVPMFECVRRRLADEIRSRCLASGTALPSARSLASAWNIDPTTVTRAYARLAAEGLVRRLPGTKRWAVALAAGSANGGGAVQPPGGGHLSQRSSAGTSRSRS